MTAIRKTACMYLLNGKITDEEQEAIQREIQANERTFALCVPVLRLLDKKCYPAHQ